MTPVAQAVTEVETFGVELRLDGRKVLMRFPAAEVREELKGRVAFLRAHRDEVSDFLRERANPPAMPPGAYLVSWNLKEPPIAIEICSIVTNPALFARTTLEQLRIALAYPKRWVGWSVPQLIDRLAQVGVTVEIESKGGER